MSAKTRTCGFRESYTSLAIDDQFFRRSENTEPNAFHRIHQCLFLFVWYLRGGLPPGTPVNHVEYTMVLLIDDVVNLYEINLHLLVELVRNTRRTDVRRTWFSPLATHRARLHNVPDVVDSGLRDSHFLQELFHGEL